MDIVGDLTIFGQPGSDAHPYQEKEVRNKIAQVRP